MKRVTILVLFVQLIGVAVVRAQTADDVQVQCAWSTSRRTVLSSWRAVRSARGRQPEGERRRALLGSPLRRFSIEAKAEGAFAEGATTGWRVHITPLGMSDGAVRFRLQWIRALDTGKEMSAKSEDVELTLRPGESRSLDSVSVPPDKNTGRPALSGTIAASRSS